MLKCQSFSPVQLFATPRTAAHRTPLSMEFFQEKIIGVGGHFPQGIFLTQGLNLSLLHCRQSLYSQSLQGSWGNSGAWTDRIPDLAVLPAHKTACKSDSLRSKRFTAMTITLNTSHLGCTGKTQFHLLFYFHFLPFSSRRWKAIIAERVGLLFCFCAAMRYLKIVFEREKKIPRKNLLLLKTLGFSCDNMWHESI